MREPVEKSESARLTDRTVQAAKPPVPPRKRLNIRDTEVPGLVLRVTDRGVKSWSIRYRLKGQEQRREVYGPSSIPSFCDARLEQ